MNDEISEFLIASIVGLLGWFFGGLDGFIKVLIACTIVDYITGICRARINRTLSSVIGFQGITRKVTMFLFVGVAHIIGQHILHDGGAMKIAVCLFYIGNEGISIVNNAEKLGLPIPKFLHGKFLNFTITNEEKVQEITQKKAV